MRTYFCAAPYAGVRLEAGGPNVPTTLRALERRIARKRARGYGISDSLSASSLFPRGMIAVSAPVRGAEGRILAAINATMVAGVFNRAQIRGPLKDQVLGAAGEISSLLGAPR